MGIRFDMTTWVLLEKSPDEEIGWTAHCLDLDIISQGNTAKDAWRSIREAVGVSILDDVEQDLDPRDRPRAPPEDWKRLEAVILSPRRRRVTVSNLDSAEISVAAVELPLIVAAQRVETPADASDDVNGKGEAWEIHDYEKGRVPSQPPVACQH